MKILFHKNFQKFVKKSRNKALVGLIKKNVDSIVLDPALGKLLEQPFRKYKVRSVGFNHGGNSFRIAYTLHEDELVFLLIDSRENFYKKLEKLI